MVLSCCGVPYSNASEELILLRNYKQILNFDSSEVKNFFVLISIVYSYK
jgi:hypothetical protein